jgi:dienelactone hydrolase
MLRQILILLVAFAGLVSSIRAQSAAGTWAGSIEANDFLGALRLDIPDNGGGGSRITLFYVGDKRTGAIEELQVSEDGVVTFLGKMQPQARFTGKLAGERITGTFDILNRNGAVAGKGVWEVRRVDPAAIAEPTTSDTTAPSFTAAIPKPTGKFLIGRTYFYWTDQSRSETITDDPNDKRKLYVQLWYPAAKSTKIRPAEYFKDADELFAGDDRLPILKTLTTHAGTDAPIAKSKTKFPLLVFSPGLGSSPFQYTGLIENLVSHGYAVAAINHPYDTGAFKFNDGSVVRYAAEKWDRSVPKDWAADERKQFFDERRIQWAKDASFVVDQLQRQNSPVTRSLDFANIGMLGHSFGGQATSVACAADERFKACANLDGLAQGAAILPDEKGTMMNQPFLFFTKAPEVTDFELRMMGMTRAQFRERDRRRILEKMNPSYKTSLADLKSGTYWLILPRAAHSSFSDSPLYDTRSTQPYAERLDLLGTINEYVLALFDKFLRKSTATLLDSGSNRRSEVIVQYLKK